MRAHLALAGLVVPVVCALGQVTSAAGAAPSTCQGLPATITSDGGPVTGTQGDDVISTTGLVDISALGGNDVICLDAGRVDAGAGNDSVQSLSAAPSSSPVAIVTVLGDGDDTLAVSAGRYDAWLGAGADRVVITGFDIGGLFDGGTDRDGLLFTDTTRIDVDLKHGGVVMGGQTFEVAGIEDVTATADRVTVRGDSKRNVFDLTGCIVKGYGAGGNDALGLGSPNGVHCTRRNLQLYGEGGNDRLTGNRLSNVLVGGGGRDAANGKGGRDRCVAESRVHCEQPGASRTVRLAALGVTAVPLSADAAVDTCQGKVATIVQSTGTVNGTDGDDVIVAGSADPFDPVTTVLAGAGNDTVCVVGGGIDVFDGGDGVDSIGLRGDNVGEGLPTVIDFEHLDIKVNFNLGELNLEWTEVPSELTGTVVADYRTGARVSKVLDNTTVDLTAPAASEDGLRVDLRSGRVSLGDGLDFALSGVNDIRMNARKIRAFGDDSRNYLILFGCDVVARGGDGNDRLWAADRKGDRRCPGVRLLGQRGPDKLDGTRRNDVLIGGPGPDLAEAGSGRDRCVAEHKKACER